MYQVLSPDGFQIMVNGDITFSSLKDDTKYIVRIDGDITKDAELNIRESSQSFDNADVCELAHILTIRELGEKAEKVNKGDVTYTSRGQKAFDYYYDLITNTLNI